SFAFGEMVAEGVAAVATARLRGVVNLAACPSRQLAVGTLIDELYAPTETDRIVVFLARAVRTREHRRPGFGIEHVIDRRDRAIVKIRRRGPDAIKRRRLVAGSGAGRVIIGEPAAPFLAEPGLLIVAAELFRDAVVPCRIRADDLERHDLVRVRPI